MITRKLEKTKIWEEDEEDDDTPFPAWAQAIITEGPVQRKVGDSYDSDTEYGDHKPVSGPLYNGTAKDFSIFVMAQKDSQSTEPEPTEPEPTQQEVKLESAETREAEPKENPVEKLALWNGDPDVLWKYWVWGTSLVGMSEVVATSGQESSVQVRFL